MLKNSLVILGSLALATTLSASVHASPLTGCNYQTGTAYYHGEESVQVGDCSKAPAMHPGYGHPSIPTPAPMPIPHAGSTDRPINNTAQGGAGGNANQFQSQQQYQTQSTKVNATGGNSSASALGGVSSSSINGGNQYTQFNQARQYRQSLQFTPVSPYGATIGITGAIDDDGYQVVLGATIPLNPLPVLTFEQQLQLAKASAPVYNNVTNVSAPAGPLAPTTTLVPTTIAPPVNAPAIPFKKVSKNG